MAEYVDKEFVIEKFDELICLAIAGVPIKPIRLEGTEKLILMEKADVAPVVLSNISLAGRVLSLRFAFLTQYGRWIKIDNPVYSPFDGSSPYLYLCDQCHKKEQSGKRFCPNCGAKMNLKKESEEK